MEKIFLRVVVNRALCISSTICRVDLEDEEDKKYATETLRDLHDWIEEFSLRESFEDDEWLAIQAPLNSIANAEITRLSWRAEGLAVLAWALEARQLPSIDKQASAQECAEVFGFFGDPIYRFPLRAKSEISALEHAMEGAQTRIYQFLSRREKWMRTESSLQSWFGRDAGTYLQFVDGDLSLFGRRLSDLSDSKLQECLSIVKERRRAVLWLIERGKKKYSNILLDI